MSQIEKTPGLLSALRGAMTPKFLATRSTEGNPNIVPCISMLPTEDQEDTLFFGNFLLRKSIRNLQEDRRLGILVVTPELKGWILKGDFIEFQRRGPYVDQQKSSSLLRYNAYTGVRNIGLIRVSAIVGSFSLSKLQVMKDYLLTRLAGIPKGSYQEEGPDQGVIIPRAVQREFARMAAVKIMAWIGKDGYPQMAPVLSLQPTGEKMLACWKRMSFSWPPSNIQVAANILTSEAISYQIKGEWSSSNGSGLIKVQEIYAGGPPYPGGRIA
jgi:hypothetical protein